MKKLLSTALLLSISSITRPMQDTSKYPLAEKLCIMPSQEELKKAICSGSNQYFCEKVRLCEELADKKKHLFGVAIAVKLAIADFEEYLRKVSPGYSNEQLQWQQRSADNTIAIMHFEKQKMIRNILNASFCNCDPIKELIDAGMLEQKQS